MKRLAIALMLIPGLAAASEFTWTVTVLDGPTREEKTYRPPDEDFMFTAGHGFDCVLRRVKQQKKGTGTLELRFLNCAHRDEGRIWSTSAQCVGNFSDWGLMFLYGLDGKLLVTVHAFCSPE